MQAVIYTRDNCPYCVSAKNFCNQNGISFSELKIGSDIIVEEFQEIFPEQKSVPLILIDGVKIGGFTELVEWYGNRPQFLSE